MRVVRPASPELRARLREIAERPLTREDFVAQLSTPTTPEEREGMASLIRWFRRRYPTPAERLAYARRAYRRWTAAAAASSRPPRRCPPRSRST